MTYPRADIAALAAGIMIVSVISGLAVFPLPPSPTFFDAVGRIGLLYAAAALAILVVGSKESRTWKSVALGSMAITFYGAIGGAVIGGVREWAFP